MQKIWRQIGFEYSDLSYFETFMQENRCKNHTTAMKELLEQHKRFQTIIKELEKAAQQADIWKQRAIKNVDDRVNKAVTEMR